MGGSPRACLLVWAALILLGWMSLTHMPGRFAMPLIVPLALLSGLPFAARLVRPANEDRTHPKGRPYRQDPPYRHVVVAGLAFAAAAVNDAWLGWRLHEHARRWEARTGVPMATLVGQTDALIAAQPLNQALPEDSHAWLVGDAAVFYVRRSIHYTVVFNRDPWLQFAESGAAPLQCLDWLRARGVTHVVFAWNEIGRLRRTYGFPELVTRSWVAQLRLAGLRRIEAVGPASDPEATEVYQVPPAEGR